MSAPLGTYLTPSFPRANPATIALFTLAGSLCIAEATALIASVGTMPIIPSQPRINGVVSGTTFSMPEYSGYDMVMGLSLAFDMAQGVIAGQLKIIPTVLIPPPQEVLYGIILGGFLASVAATKSGGFYGGLMPNLQVIFYAMADFIRGLYTI